MLNGGTLVLRILSKFRLPKIIFKPFFSGFCTEKNPTFVRIGIGVSVLVASSCPIPIPFFGRTSLQDFPAMACHWTATEIHHDLNVETFRADLY